MSFESAPAIARTAHESIRELCDTIKRQNEGMRLLRFQRNFLFCEEANLDSSDLEKMDDQVLSVLVGPATAEMFFAEYNGKKNAQPS